MSGADKPFAFRGKYFALVVLVFYSLLFIVNSDAGLAALIKSGTVLLTILPIVMGVIVFTAVLNFFLRPKLVVKHLGSKSGIKAWAWALGAGILAHGPMYVWYSTLEDLRRHGMRDGLIVTVFAARVIKLPPLPLMIEYFGLSFTLILTFYILTGALAQGWLIGKMEAGT